MEVLLVHHQIFCTMKRCQTIWRVENQSGVISKWVAKYALKSKMWDLLNFCHALKHSSRGVNCNFEDYTTMVLSSTFAHLFHKILQWILYLHSHIRLVHYKHHSDTLGHIVLQCICRHEWKHRKLQDTLEVNLNVSYSTLYNFGFQLKTLSTQHNGQKCMYMICYTMWKVWSRYTTSALLHSYFWLHPKCEPKTCTISMNVHM